MSLIELRDIHKSFYGVEVLHGVNLVLQPGTVHALMGENGAGKSTLMKVIAGVHAADSGKVFMDDREVEITSPAKARELGIAMIHQELSSSWKCPWRKIFSWEGNRDGSEWWITVSSTDRRMNC